jgi:dynactin 1
VAFFFPPSIALRGCDDTWERGQEQAIQESAVKIELMEKRMEGVKKQVRKLWGDTSLGCHAELEQQADAMAELEAELAKSKKQEKAYEEAIEALQADLDSMEQENIKLKQAAPSADKSGASRISHVFRAQTIDYDLNEGHAGAFGEGEFIAFTGSLETSHLIDQVSCVCLRPGRWDFGSLKWTERRTNGIEQIESLRGAVRYLRAQNALLKSDSLLSDLATLPSYTQATAAAGGVPGGGGSSDDDARSVASESKALLKEAVALSSAPRVVDLSKVRPGKGWVRAESRPERQFAARQGKVQELLRRVDALRERAGDSRGVM